MATSTTLAKNRKTPGVYITEFPAFPPSIVGVATAVPIFVGYTETAADPSSGQQTYLQAIPISSLADYLSYFGQGFNAKGAVVQIFGSDDPKKKIDYDFQTDYQVLTTSGQDSVLESRLGYFSVGTSAEGDTGAGPKKTLPQFNLFSAIQLFYANGGGNCYVVSVGNYTGQPDVLADPSKLGGPIKLDPLSLGLDVARETRGPTMIVVPDACLLTEKADYQAIVQKMLTQAASLKDRVAILDLPGALDDKNWTVPGLRKQADEFHADIAPASAAFSYGAAYAPALESSLLSIDDIDYRNLNGDAAFSSATQINNLLTSQALKLYPQVYNATEGKYEYSPKFQAIAARIAAAYPPSGTLTPWGSPADITSTTAGPPSNSKAEPRTDPEQILVSKPNNNLPAPDATDQKLVQALDQYLVNALPLTGKIEQILADQLNVVPASGAMAGIWSLNDSTRGVWNAPANLSLAGIVAPKVYINDEDQADLNVPLNGNAIDILRIKPGRGTVVWGARTLDGNSPDYRFIQVRRTLNYIEQSIKIAMQPFVFAANDGGTWVTVTAAVQNFLTQLWQAGGLMGDKPNDAFTVSCGVPTTMSALDVLNGYMIVNVTVSLIRPAEFIELTFKQTMQGA